MTEPLAPCPNKPNCVCSRGDANARQYVEPFAVTGEPAAVFGRLRALLAAMPRTIVVTATDNYLHAECRSRLGFIDDLECRLSPSEGVIHLRSATRHSWSWYDFGVNRKRIEHLRDLLDRA